MEAKELKEKLQKVRSKLYKRSALAVFLHVSCLFFANLFTVLVDTIAKHNPLFVFFMTLGSAVIILTGLHRTVESIYNDSVEETKKILKESE